MLTIEKVLNLKGLKEVSYKITAEGRQQLLAVIKYCEEEKVKFSKLKSLLINFINYDVPPDWVKRIRLSREVYKNDAASLQCCINRYGDEIGVQKYKDKVSKSTLTKEKYLLTHSIDEWNKLNRSKANNNMEILIEKYGPEEAQRRKEKYLKNWTDAVKKKGGWDNGLSLEKLTEKFGEEEAFKRWNKKREKQKKRFSKEWYVNKYGQAQGEIKWAEYKLHMTKLSEQANRKSSANYSKASQKLFNEIVAKFDPPLTDVFYHDCNGEKLVKKYIDGKYVSYYALDFLYRDKNIEYDGVHWHTDPEKDKTRDKYLSTKGYKILRITDTEYKIDPLEVIKKCIKFLGEQNE